MESITRKPLQGVKNIVRFNWHFYALAIALLILLAVLCSLASKGYALMLLVVMCGIILSIALSLLVSLYIYDFSGFYALDWIQYRGEPVRHILNIHAGFDETSAGLQAKFPEAQLQVFDFYDPLLHTELSIQRARKAYPPYPGTIPVSSKQLPAISTKADLVFLIFAAHEIRNKTERVQFLQGVKERMREGGRLYLVEHLRDFPNMLVYNIGALHFYGRNSWLSDMDTAGFRLVEEKRFTPFVRIFIYQHHGTTY